MDHEHVWGEIHLAHFTGNPHRKCIVEGCHFITLDLKDDDDEQEYDDYDDEPSVNPLQNAMQSTQGMGFWSE